MDTIRTTFMIVVALLALSGCGGGNGSDGQNGSNGLSTLTKVTTEAPGTNCPTGGSKIESGLDSNANNVLDANEVNSTNYVCSGPTGSNGSNGNATLINVTAEAAGANCPNGGSRVDAGLDGNINQVLDAAEITTTSYVCNGASGQSGSNGISTLTKVTTEAAGSNCPTGGSRVDAGLDSNANGTLDAAEITTTSYVCGGATGSDGLAALIRVTVEAAGANCADGGSKVESGLDGNANDVLDTAEISATSYVCNGATGTAGADGVDGANGISTLLHVAPEPAGANCPTSGTRVDAGPDANANGVLDAAEVSTTSYVCSGPGVRWVEVIADVQAASNTGYLASSDTRITITLPSAPAIGDIVRVSGVGTGGWKITPSAGQSLITKDIVGNIGAVWTARDSDRNWSSVASSSDGAKLVAVENLGGQIYTSTDSGVTWTPRNSARDWTSVASSADGSKLVAVAKADLIYTSTNWGVTWIPHDTFRAWRAVTSSADGTKLVAVEEGGRIYTSTDTGATWTPRDSARSWNSVASSSDGAKLVATDYGGNIYTSIDSGVTWTPRHSARNWINVASSSDGTKLVAVDFGGYIYTSIDSGVTWTPRDSSRSWRSVASSADGSRLVAGMNNGQIYTSTDSGMTWTPHDSVRSRTSIASSADGTKLVAVVFGGQIYTSTPTAVQTTTDAGGAAGSISGAQYDAIELQYIGNNTFTVLSYAGYLAVQ